jgi:hypothetical protein
MNTTKRVIIGSIAVISLTFGLLTIASADPGGRSWGYGFFTNEGRQTTGFGQVITGGITNSTNKNTFITGIIDKLENGTARNKTGAAFIIQTMRGAPYSHVRPTAADIEDWKKRVNNPAVQIFLEDYTYSWNSGFMKDVANDDAFYPYTDTRHSLVFKIAGVVKFAIKQDCGNPVGELSLPPPPPDNWSITPSVTINKTSAVPGDTLNWTHSIKNNGPDVTNKLLTYYWKGGQGLSGQGPNWTVAASPGLAKDASVSQPSSYVVQAGDVGKSLCRMTSAAPFSYGDPQTVSSGWACAYVSPPDTSTTACRPIQVTLGTPSVDVHSGSIPSIHVKATNNFDGTVIDFGTHNHGDTINFTAKCTTGDKWTIREYTDSYVYYHYDDTHYYSCGTAEAPATCSYDDHHNFSTVYSKNTVIGPCFDYILRSSINSFDAKLEPGSSVDIKPSIDNKSYTQANNNPFWLTYKTQTKSKPTKWQITKMVIAPNIDVPGSVLAGDSGDKNYNPCSYFDPTGISTCSTTPALSDSVGNTVFGVTGNQSPSTSRTFTVPDSPAGTKICFAFSIFPSKSDPNSAPTNASPYWGGVDVWNHAAYNPTDNCIVIVKKPKTQIWGGDLWSQKSVSTGTSVKDIGGSYTFGSWVEYGIFSPETITGMASGSAFAGTAGLAGSNPICNYSTLTFTSAGSSTCTPGTQKGVYSSLRVIPDVEANFPGDGTEITTNSIVPNDLHN